MRQIQVSSKNKLKKCAYLLLRSKHFIIIWELNRSFVITITINRSLKWLCQLVTYRVNLTRHCQVLHRDSTKLHCQVMYCFIIKWYFQVQYRVSIKLLCLRKYQTIISWSKSRQHQTTLSSSIQRHCQTTSSCYIQRQYQTTPYELKDWKKNVIFQNKKF